MYLLEHYPYLCVVIPPPPFVSVCHVADRGIAFFFLFSALLSSLMWESDECSSVQLPLLLFSYSNPFHWLTRYYYLQLGVYVSHLSLSISVYSLNLKLAVNRNIE